MTGVPPSSPCVAIACGGTGGHLFPGLAVGEQLRQHGFRVRLLVSSKEVDQQAVKGVSNMGVLSLPAVGLVRGRYLAFIAGFWRSYSIAKQAFASDPPQAALAMGGFTSAPPILAAKRLGARTFLHESNTIPGRANRWLSRWVDRAFVGFPGAATRLHGCEALSTGTPVRAQFRLRNPGECRQTLGLAPELPVVLVVGGSQGASGINRLIMQVLPLLGPLRATWQWLHLAGTADVEPVRRAYATSQTRALVLPFLSEMELALGAATAAVSRAGASSLAELAAMQLPSVLVPYPAATDNHQFYNARAYADSGAACLLPQNTATPEAMLGLLRQLVESATERARMQRSLAQWYAPRAAEVIAAEISRAIGAGAPHPKTDCFSAGAKSDASQDRSGTVQFRQQPHLQPELR